MPKTIASIFIRMHDLIVSKIAYEKCDIETRRILYQFADELNAVFARYKAILEQKESR